MLVKERYGPIYVPRMWIASQEKINDLKNIVIWLYGLGSVVNSTTHIPIEKYKEVCDATNQWKIYYEKLQKEHTLLQEHRREEGGLNNAKYC